MFSLPQLFHRGSRGIAVRFHDHGTRRGWRVSVTLRPLFTPGKDPVPIIQEAGWAPGLVWTDAENFSLTGIWSPDRPARSQSLYGLGYPGRSEFHYSNNIMSTGSFLFNDCVKNYLWTAMCEIICEPLCVKLFVNRHVWNYLWTATCELICEPLCVKLLVKRYVWNYL